MAKQLKNNSNFFEQEISTLFSTMGTMCIISIIVSVIFCLAITIAYERSKSNENKIEKLMLNRKTKDKVIKANNINMEIDDDIDNIAKENECPVCFHHINKNDKQCSNCGTKLK